MLSVSRECVLLARVAQIITAAHRLVISQATRIARQKLDQSDLYFTGQNRPPKTMGVKHMHFQASCNASQPMG